MYLVNVLIVTKYLVNVPKFTKYLVYSYHQKGVKHYAFNNWNQISKFVLKVWVNFLDQEVLYPGNECYKPTAIYFY